MGDLINGARVKLCTRWLRIIVVWMLMTCFVRVVVMRIIHVLFSIFRIRYTTIWCIVHATRFTSLPDDILILFVSDLIMLTMVLVLTNYEKEKECLFDGSLGCTSVMSDLIIVLSRYNVVGVYNVRMLSTRGDHLVV